jgi:hypothetical protein
VERLERHLGKSENGWPAYQVSTKGNARAPIHPARAASILAALVAVILQEDISHLYEQSASP